MSTYNGWANYETWVAKLWLDNDEGTYNEVRDIFYAYGPDGLAQRLEEYVREMVEMDESSLRADLLGSALSSVDWQEIADAYSADYGLDDDDDA